MKIKPVLITVLFLAACSGGARQVSIFDVSPVSKNTLIIVGEGGPSGSMFLKAAETYQREELGGGLDLDSRSEIYEVHSGDEFTVAVKDFIERNGKIQHLEYFGHGNHVGLYVNQEPGLNGGVYANDPELNTDYPAASIYELDADIFDENGWIRFNGCNVANGYPERNSLAQSFANHFDVDVVAPLGPTEFSRTRHVVNPIENSNYLDPDFDEPVYMVSTYGDRSFVVVPPQSGSEKFVDLREGQTYHEAVLAMTEMGLNLDFTESSSGQERFLPYENVTYPEALEFCRVALGRECAFGKGGDYWIRNLRALQMLVDNYGVELKYTDPWYDSYVWWAKNEELLIDDFTNKKWLTRGEMAELTWNFVRYFTAGQAPTRQNP